ncbi:M13 family peptidase, partial [Klebsiella pneumoniae]|nr:M13 family peptidase [Klebsiella pneumoniae]
MNAKGIDTKFLQEMVVGQPDFLEGANKVVGALKPAEYRDVLEWSLVEGSANYLNDAAAAESFDFYGKIKAGRKENHPLWKRSTGQVERVMGEA